MRKTNFDEFGLNGFNKMIDKNSNSPLHFAAFSGNVGCIRLFIEKANCRVDVTNK